MQREGKITKEIVTQLATEALMKNFIVHKCASPMHRLGRLAHCCFHGTHIRTYRRTEGYIWLLDVIFKL